MDHKEYPQFWTIMSKITRSGDVSYQGIYMDLSVAKSDFAKDKRTAPNGCSGQLCGPFELADGVSVDPLTCSGRVIDSYGE